jgi:HEPN domain-containing protein
MEKKDYISYWNEEAETSWKMAQKLLESSDWVYALFFFHLSLEKLFKAIWVQDNVENFPTRTHDLQTLCNQTTLELDAEMYSYLAVVTSWNLETRYPDYKRLIFKRTDEKFAMNQLAKLEELRKCLLEKLSSKR